MRSPSVETLTKSSFKYLTRHCQIFCRKTVNVYLLSFVSNETVVGEITGYDEDLMSQKDEHCINEMTKIR